MQHKKIDEKRSLVITFAANILCINAFFDQKSFICGFGIICQRCTRRVIRLQRNLYLNTDRLESVNFVSVDFYNLVRKSLLNEKV